MISIIIPALNEAAIIETTLRAVTAIEGEKEIIVVDGGSGDETRAIAARCGVRVLASGRGRGVQMHAGALAASGDVFWFLHADTTPSKDAICEIAGALSNPKAVGGNFTPIFDGTSLAARHLTLTYAMLRLFRLSYGDAGIFVRRSVYEQIGGFKPVALFEDVDLIRRIRRQGKFVHLECRVTTSSRRFEGKNYARVWALWMTLQLLYWVGAPPATLAKWYRHER